MGNELNNFDQKMESVGLWPAPQNNNLNLKSLQNNLFKNYNLSLTERRDARDILEYNDVDEESPKDQDEAGFSIFSWWKQNNWKKGPPQAAYRTKGPPKKVTSKSVRPNVREELPSTELSASKEPGASTTGAENEASSNEGDVSSQASDASSQGDLAATDTSSESEVQTICIVVTTTPTCAAIPNFETTPLCSTEGSNNETQAGTETSVTGESGSESAGTEVSSASEAIGTTSAESTVTGTQPARVAGKEFREQVVVPVFPLRLGTPMMIPVSVAANSSVRYEIVTSVSKVPLEQEEPNKLQENILNENSNKIITTDQEAQNAGNNFKEYSNLQAGATQIFNMEKKLNSGSTSDISEKISISDKEIYTTISANRDINDKISFFESNYVSQTQIGLISSIDNVHLTDIVETTYPDNSQFTTSMYNNLPSQQFFYKYSLNNVENQNHLEDKQYNFTFTDTPSTSSDLGNSVQDFSIHQTTSNYSNLVVKDFTDNNQDIINYQRNSNSSSSIIKDVVNNNKVNMSNNKDITNYETHTNNNNSVTKDMNNNKDQTNYQINSNNNTVIKDVVKNNQDITSYEISSHQKNSPITELVNHNQEIINYQTNFNKSINSNLVNNNQDRTSNEISPLQNNSIKELVIQNQDTTNYETNFNKSINSNLVNNNQEKISYEISPHQNNSSIKELVNQDTTNYEIKFNKSINSKLVNNNQDKISPHQNNSSIKELVIQNQVTPNYEVNFNKSINSKLVNNNQERTRYEISPNQNNSSVKELVIQNQVPSNYETNFNKSINSNLVNNNQDRNSYEISPNQNNSLNKELVNQYIPDYQIDLNRSLHTGLVNNNQDSKRYEMNFDNSYYRETMNNSQNITEHQTSFKNNSSIIKELMSNNQDVNNFQASSNDSILTGLGNKNQNSSIYQTEGTDEINLDELENRNINATDDIGIDGINNSPVDAMVLGDNSNTNIPLQFSDDLRRTDIRNIKNICSNNQSLDNSSFINESDTLTNGNQFKECNGNSWILKPNNIKSEAGLIKSKPANKQLKHVLDKKNKFSNKLYGSLNGVYPKLSDVQRNYKTSFIGDGRTYDENDPDIFISRPYIKRNKLKHSMISGIKNNFELRVQPKVVTKKTSMLSPNYKFKKKVKEPVEEESSMLIQVNKGVDTNDADNRCIDDDDLYNEDKEDVFEPSLDKNENGLMNVDEAVNEGNSMSDYFVGLRSKCLKKRNLNENLATAQSTNSASLASLSDSQKTPPDLQKADFVIEDNNCSYYKLHDVALPEICKNVSCNVSDYLSQCCARICIPFKKMNIESSSYNQLPIPGYPYSTLVNGSSYSIDVHRDKIDSLANYVQVNRNIRNAQPESSLSDVIKFHLMHGIFAPDGKELLKALKEAKYQMQKVNMEFHPEMRNNNPTNPEIHSLSPFADMHSLSKKQPEIYSPTLDSNKILEDLRTSLWESIEHNKGKQMSKNLEAPLETYRTVRNQEVKDQLESIIENNSVLEKLKQETESEMKRLVELEMRRREEEKLFNKEREHDLRELQAIQELMHREFVSRKENNEADEIKKYAGIYLSGKDDTFQRSGIIQSWKPPKNLPQQQSTDLLSLNKNLTNMNFPELDMNNNLTEPNQSFLSMNKEIKFDDILGNTNAPEMKIVPIVA